jgi:ketosteroid isomerase-like protein
MGTLKFDFIRLSFPGPDVAFLLGKFHLTRPEKGDLSGFYTLLWRKIKGKWVIVSDHTS